MVSRGEPIPAQESREDTSLGIKWVTLSEDQRKSLEVAIGKNFELQAGIDPLSALKLKENVLEIKGKEGAKRAQAISRMLATEAREIRTSDKKERGEDPSDIYFLIAPGEAAEGGCITFLNPRRESKNFSQKITNQACENVNVTLEQLGVDIVLPKL